MTCPICSCGNSKILYEAKEQFTNKGALELILCLEVCENCGFVFLSNAYTKEYQELIKRVYENFDKSNVFKFPNRSVENKNALSMIGEYLNLNMNILEIGSNRGDLLYLIKEEFKTVNILGIEPTQNQKVYVPTIKGFFDKNLFSNKFDFIIMQHVLEHIVNPKNVVDDIYHTLNENGVVYIEVPSLEYALENNIEDFMLEHVSYFTNNSLLALFKNFEVLAINEEPFLRVIFRKSNQISATKKDDYRLLQNKFMNFHQDKTKILQEIKQFIDEGKEIVFFGVSFYFKKIYTDISKICDIRKSYFIDDNFDKDIEPNFNLQRKDNLSSNEVVILCSNNFDVQKRMAAKIANTQGLTIIMPWNQILQGQGK